MKQLKPVAAFVDEGEDGSVAGIFTELAGDERMEAVEAFAHVAGFEREEDAQAAGECQHARAEERWRSNSTTSGI